MNQKQHSRSENSAGWQQVQSQPFEASQQAELQRPVNRSYKDTLFRMLFQEKEALLSLYNAVGQTDYKDASQLEIVTLENAIYMNMKNDLAFLINLELNLYEHQSTWNPNMPLRDLFYVAKEYEQLIRKETLYSSRLVKLPVPRFLVFCNGRMPDQAEKIILKLSDSFEKQTGEPELELKVTVLNINAGLQRDADERLQAVKGIFPLCGPGPLLRLSDGYERSGQPGGGGMYQRRNPGRFSFKITGGGSSYEHF